MTRHHPSLLALTIAATLFATTAASAAEPPEPVHLGAFERAAAKRATEMLDRAVATLEKEGPEKAFAAFNDPKGPFINGAYYVFVVGMDGFMHADGGAPTSLAGKSALGLRDAAGKPIIADLLFQAKDKPTGTIDYRWLNRVSHRLELKVSLYRKVGDYVVCVGYYTPRASKEEAQDLLDKAVTFLKTSGGNTAFTAFNNPQGGFMHNDQYVFAIGIDDGKYRAYGASPQLTGMDGRGLLDATGKPVVEEIIKVAKEKNSGIVEYMWRNPATNAVEQKSSLIQRVDDMVLGVGYYTK